MLRVWVLLLADGSCDYVSCMIMCTVYVILRLYYQCILVLYGIVYSVQSITMKKTTARTHIGQSSLVELAVVEHPKVVSRDLELLKARIKRKVARAHTHTVLLAQHSLAFA